MLAVFHKSLAGPSLKLIGTVVVENLPTEQSEETMKELSRLFKNEHQDPMAIHLLPYCILNTVLDHKSVITPRVLMAFHAFGELDHMEPFSSRLAWRWRAQSVKVSMENYPKGVTMLVKKG